MTWNPDDKRRTTQRRGIYFHLAAGAIRSQAAVDKKPGQSPGDRSHREAFRKLMLYAIPRMNAYILAFSLAFLPAIAAAATSCESLASIRAARRHHHRRNLVEAGAFPAPPGRGPNAGAVYKTLPAFCRVAATLKPSSDSEIKIEVWMPAAAMERQTAIRRQWRMGRLDQLSRDGHGSRRRICRRQHRHRPSKATAPTSFPAIRRR